MIRDWPTALIVLGIVMSLVWAGLLIWLLLRLLHVA
jgi:hypothetical protein